MGDNPRLLDDVLLSRAPARPGSHTDIREFRDKVQILWRWHLIQSLRGFGSYDCVVSGWIHRQRRCSQVVLPADRLLRVLLRSHAVTCLYSGDARLEDGGSR